MAMDFGNASKKVGDAVTTGLIEGGGVVVGLIGAGIAGKQLEVLVKPNVTTVSPVMDKLLAWGSNNATKVALHWAIGKFAPKSGFVGEVLHEAQKGAVASVALDSIVRLGNHGAPGTGLMIYGHNVMGDINKTASTQEISQLQANFQKVVQDNSTLRTQLNQAMGKLASATPNVSLTPYPDHDRAYGMMNATPEAVERRKNFGSMESEAPIIAERNRKFGAMGKPQMNFAGDQESISAAYGML